jgi:hypothetical protein
MKRVLRLCGDQHAALRQHLFPGDGLEAAALILCGRREDVGLAVLTAAEIFSVPYAACSDRRADYLSWRTEAIIPALERAAAKKFSIVKVHSHPTGYERFSALDDASDGALFPSLYGWLGDAPFHASAVMLPDGRMFGRMVDETNAFNALDRISVAGDDLHFWDGARDAVEAGFMLRNAQAFGAGTAAILRRLSIAVIGCSGTGSPLIEQLVRLGVGRLVLVDPDSVEEKNLNRILHTTMADARAPRKKVDVLREAIDSIGLGTEVEVFAKTLDHPDVVRAVAGCDLVFGCMDTIDGRHLLNRLATFYLLPYFDLGVRLVADGLGGVSHVCGTVHYMQPGRSSLLSRGLYSTDQLQAASLKRTNPAEYASRLSDGYIAGVNEERPAVISVNTLVSSLAVNEFLARLHPYRQFDNREFAIHRVSLEQGQFYREAEGPPCPALSRWVGRGDLSPLLDLPALSVSAGPL